MFYMVFDGRLIGIMEGNHENIPLMVKLMLVKGGKKPIPVLEACLTTLDGE